ncbi:hypothetical protein Ocin01_11236 [Orchesella cincta]|uniref:Uncharacterized protein n=1 Tax=Orchesella cincta TaxID=48709 RepID=A0A1D2MRC0_ORCCI|nr:hypothetical protein Ocin01_11236 [Orchesella cincta]
MQCERHVALYGNNTERASREMLDEDMLQLDCIVPCYTVSTSEIPTSAAAASTTVSIVTSAGSPATAAKTRSLTNLSTRLPLSIAPSQFEESTGDLSDSEERAKSLEFLLDENHKSSSVPPENKLRLETRQLSEHELRIQRSLQRLNVPEWYKQHETLSSNASSGASSQYTSAAPNITKRSDYGSSGGLAGGWTGLSTYKAPSMSSLQSNGGRSSGTLKSNFVRGRPATMSVTRTSKESLLTGSANHSPSAFERSSFTYGMPFTMTRFGQGRLSTHSGSVSPPSTPDSTVKTSSYVKKPYLGWRSQERLNPQLPLAFQHLELPLLPARQNFPYTYHQQRD